MMKLKNKKVIILLSIISFIVLIIGWSFNRESLYLKDFKYLINFIDESYPYKEDLGNWKENKKKFIKEVDAIHDENAYIEYVSNFILKFNNEHFYLVPDDEIRNLYENLNCVNESLKEYFDYLFELFNDKAIISAYQLTDINQTETCDLVQHVENVENVFELIEVDQQNAILKIDSFNFSAEQGNEAWRALDLSTALGKYANLYIDLRKNRGGNTSAWVMLASKLSKQDAVLHSYTVYNDSPFTKSYLDLFQIETSPLGNLSSDHPIMAAFDQKVDYEYSSYSEGYIEIKASESSYKGEIYLIVSNYTASAAEQFALFCKENKIAKTIGSKTSGTGSDQPPIYIKLPYSGLIFKMPAGVGIDYSGKINFKEKLIPDNFVKNVMNDDVLYYFIKNGK